MTMGCPSRLYQNSYPADFKNTWPIGEGYFNTPWVWAHSEFTPQQTMRGKTALYGYLYALGGASTPTFALTVGKAGTGSGTVTSSPAGISCGSDCSESYASGTSVTLTASAVGGSTFAGWSGACSGTGTCTVSMTAARSVTATFNTSGGTRGTFGNNGNPWAIAASGTTRIQAENFDTGGEGVAYHDTDVANSGGQYRTTEGVDIQATTDTGGGYNVGWIGAGEWLEFTVNVAAAGTYDLRLRSARQPTGTSTLSVLFGGVDKTGSLAVPSTGGWQTWADLTKTGVSLSAGQQFMRISLTGGSYNLNWIEITAAPASQTLTVTKAGTGSGTVTLNARGHQLRQHLQRELRERDERHAHRRAGRGLDLRRLERRLLGNGKLRRDDERGAIRDGHIQRHDARGDDLRRRPRSGLGQLVLERDDRLQRHEPRPRRYKGDQRDLSGLGRPVAAQGHRAEHLGLHRAQVLGSRRHGLRQVAARLHPDSRHRRRECFRRRQRAREHLDRDHGPSQLARQPRLDQAPQHPGEQRRHAADDDVRRDPPDALADGNSTASTTPQGRNCAQSLRPVTPCYRARGRWLSSWSGFQRCDPHPLHAC